LSAQGPSNLLKTGDGDYDQSVKLTLKAAQRAARMQADARWGPTRSVNPSFIKNLQDHPQAVRNCHAAGKKNLLATGIFAAAQ
jgi:hypothetical protein